MSVSDLSKLSGVPSAGSADNRPPNVVRGTVQRAPVDARDSMLVEIDGYTSMYPLEVPSAQWSTRSGAIPVKGARCIVLITPDNDVWVPTWHGEDGIVILDGGGASSTYLTTADGGGAVV